jgi:hypothetical protein
MQNADFSSNIIDLSLLFFLLQRRQDAKLFFTQILQIKQITILEFWIIKGSKSAKSFKKNLLNLQNLRETKSGKIAAFNESKSNFQLVDYYFFNQSFLAFGYFNNVDTFRKITCSYKRNSCILIFVYFLPCKRNNFD